MLARDGGMNVPNITQSLGSVATLPRAEAPDASTAPRAVAAAPPAAAGASSGVSLARLAWFDVNGDGHIDPRSTTSGGDATLLVPSHSVDLPTYRRTVSAVGGPRPVNASERPPAVPASAAQTSRAVDAYQRYGQSPAVATATALALPSVSPASGADRSVA